MSKIKRKHSDHTRNSKSSKSSKSSRRVSESSKSNHEYIDDITKNNLIEHVKKFQSLNLKLDRSPSQEYFHKLYSKIYSEYCIKITYDLLSNIKKLDEKLESLYITESNVKSFLYAYVIVVNHENIFGFNSDLEKMLINSSMDMLYIFLNLCKRIENLDTNKLSYLLGKFYRKYQEFYKNYNSWQKKDAKSLLDILVSSYYYLSHNLVKINKNDNRFDKINDQIHIIENKIQYLLMDNHEKDKTHKILSNGLKFDNIEKIYKKAETHFWDIKNYNIENNIEVNKNLSQILHILNKRMVCYLEKQGKKNILEHNPIPDYITFLNNNHIMKQDLYNYHLFNIINFIIKVLYAIGLFDNVSKDSMKDEIDEIVYKKRCTEFAQNLLRSGSSKVLLNFFKDMIGEFDEFEDC